MYCFPDFISRFFKRTCGIDIKTPSSVSALETEPLSVDLIQEPEQVGQEDESTEMFHNLSDRSAKELPQLTLLPPSDDHGTSSRSPANHEPQRSEEITLVCPPTNVPRNLDPPGMADGNDRPNDKSISTPRLLYNVEMTLDNVEPSVLDTNHSTPRRQTEQSSRDSEEDLDIGDPVDDVLNKEAPGKEHSLASRLWNVRIYHPKGESRVFIPADELKKLITLESVRAEIKELHPTYDDNIISKYGNKIFSTAPKLFATLVWIKKGEFICRFLKNGFNDKDLPLVRIDPDNTRDIVLRSKRRPNEEINILSSWIPQDIEALYCCQWWMLAPVFNVVLKARHYEFEDNIVLPFIEDFKKEKSRPGGYSEVWGVRIHAAHQKLYQSTDPDVKEPMIAVKRLHSQIQADFDLEVAMLHAFRKKPHRHLVKLLATFKLKNRFYLMFPYANSNLREYWQEIGTPNWTATTILWTLKQCKGMASGLDSIHNYKASSLLLGDKASSLLLGDKASSLLLSDKASPQHLGAPVDKHARSSTESEKDGKLDARWFGRHGDIKPENILWSKELPDTDDQGILQIADFGLGRFNGIGSRSGINPAGVSASPTYRPPEIEVSGGSISRASDIWSLGCVFLEFIVWLLFGSDNLIRFSQGRGEVGINGIDEDTFYTLTEDDGRKTACIRRGVVDWIEKLHQATRCSDLMHDFLDIVADEMLQVETEQRTKIGPLVSRLADLLKKAKDDDYALTPTKRRSSTQHPILTITMDKGPPSSPASPTEGRPLPVRKGSISISPGSIMGQATLESGQDIIQGHHRRVSFSFDHVHTPTNNV